MEEAYRVLIGDGDRVLVSKASRIRELTTGVGYRAFVSAQSRAVEQLGREIAASIKKAGDRR